jgi:hypothetical protein
MEDGSGLKKREGQELSTASGRSLEYHCGATEIRGCIRPTARSSGSETAGRKHTQYADNLDRISKEKGKQDMLEYFDIKLK